MPPTTRPPSYITWIGYQEMVVRSSTGVLVVVDNKGGLGAVSEEHCLGIFDE